MGRKNDIARILLVIGLTVMVVCFFVGIIIGTGDPYVDQGPLWPVVLQWWIGGFVVGMLFIGFSEAIELLHDIRLNTMDESARASAAAGISGGAATWIEEDFHSGDGGWSITDEDKNRLHDLYKGRAIADILETPFEDYCLVFLDGETEPDIVVVGGFKPVILSPDDDPELQRRIREWYQKME